MNKLRTSAEQNQLGSAPMLPLIIRMSLPAVFSMLIQSLYNIVDSIYVAQISEAALTAVSLAFPLQQMIIAVSVGTGVGLNSVISRRLGEKQQQEADRTASHGIFLGILCGIIFAVIGLFSMQPFFSAFTKDGEIFSMGCQYGYMVMLFSFATFLQINCEKILQATGNMVWPMIFQLTGTVANIILDPIFIFGWFGLPEMGVLGAAIATVIGQMLGMALGIYVLLRKKHSVHVRLSGFSPSKKILADIYKVGFPAIVMQALSPVLNMGLNAILSGISQSAVAVMGIYTKFQTFVFMPVIGLSQGLMPITGYNFGAGNKERLRQSLKLGMILALGVMAVETALFNAIPDLLLDMFNASSTMKAIGVPALHIISISFMFAAVSLILSNFLQATGSGTRSLLISFLRQLLIPLPIAFVFSYLLKMGETGAWLSIPIAEIVSVVVAVGVVLPVYRRMLANNPQPVGALSEQPVL